MRIFIGFITIMLMSACSRVVAPASLPKKSLAIEAKWENDLLKLDVGKCFAQTLNLIPQISVDYLRIYPASTLPIVDLQLYKPEIVGQRLLADTTYRLRVTGCIETTEQVVVSIVLITAEGEDYRLGDEYAFIINGTSKPSLPTKVIENKDGNGIVIYEKGK